MPITQPGIRRQQEVRYGASGQTVTCWPDIDGAATNPTGTSTVSIYLPGHETAQVSAATATEDAVTFQLSYALDASVTATYALGENYRAVFSFVVAGVTHLRTILFDIVRRPLNRFCPIRIDDLLNAYAWLEASLSNESQATDAFQRYILPAWEEVLLWIDANGRRPSLVSSPESLKPMVHHLALYNVCKGLTQSPGDLADKHAEESFKNFERMRDITVLRYNEADGFVTDKSRGFNQPRLRYGPDTAMGVGYRRNRTPVIT